MNWLPDYFNDIGFFVTFFGFLVAIIQIFKIQNRQKAIQIASEQAIKKITLLDNVIKISKAKETITFLKELVKQKNYNFVDQKIPELKEELHHCKSICTTNTIDLQSILQSINTIQSNINNVLINPDNDFDVELFFTTLDQIRDIFALTIDECKK